MQAPTHVLAGVIIQKAYDRVKQKWLRVLLIAFSGLFFHSVFDRIARLTYHPPDPDFKSFFWVSYHSLVLIGFIVSLYYFWKPYKLGIIFSILPDFDWVIIHGSKILNVPLEFYDRPWLHTITHYVVDHVPPFSFLQYLPDLTHQPTGFILEVVLDAALLCIIWAMLRKR